MGWDGVNTGGLSNAEFLRKHYEESGNEVLAQSKRGTIHYMLYRMKTGEVTISVIYTRSDKNDFFNLTFKALNEFMYPHAFDCPVRWLDKVTSTDNENANKWRETVKRLYQEKVAKRKAGYKSHGYFSLTYPPQLHGSHYRPEFCYIPKKEKGQRHYAYPISKYDLATYMVGKLNPNDVFRVEGDLENFYVVNRNLPIRISNRFLTSTDAQPLKLVPYHAQAVAAE